MRILFRGTSGCDLKLVDELRVRKTSPNIPYNPRLCRQKELQRRASDIGVATPHIVSEGEDDTGRA